MTRGAGMGKTQSQSEALCAGSAYDGDCLLHVFVILLQACATLAL